MSEAIEAYKGATSLYGERKYEEAIEAYSRALEHKPDWAEAILGLAMAQMQAGKLDEAIATGNRVVELDPNDPSAYTSLSMFWQRKGDIDEAEKQQAKARMASWKQELKDNPNAPPPEDGGMKVVQ